MPKIAYRAHRFNPQAEQIIAQAVVICEEYAAQSFTLTLRQLYYQFVARGYIPNRDTEYKRIGSIINDARMAGELDWDFLEDRTRNVRALGHWDDPAHIIVSAAVGFRIDKWANQHYRPEVWIEKDALVGVIEGVCEAHDIPFFSCRGYTSQSEVWGAAQRMVGYLENGQTPLILHLGDHDPSGLDMTRDITDRLRLFIAHDFLGSANPEDCDESCLTLERLALNLDQVRQYNPPPNPAKSTDARFEGYYRTYGSESWELDALNPPVIAALIEDAVDRYEDHDAWEEAVAHEEHDRELLRRTYARWGEVQTYLEGANS